MAPNRSPTAEEYRRETLRRQAILNQMQGPPAQQPRQAPEQQMSPMQFIINLLSSGQLGNRPAK